MEARASLSGASVSKAFVAAILVIVALGLTAMGGYLAHSLSQTSAAGTQGQTYAAPGTVLRQDNPGVTRTGAVDLPSDYGWLKQVGYEGGGTIASQPEERSTGHKELP